MGKRQRDLMFGLLFDGIGMLSFAVPGVGEFADLVWAPVSAYLMLRMYKGNAGKVAAAFDFVEEILPFTDWSPSFTLMWCYHYLIKGTKEETR